MTTILLMKRAVPILVFIFVQLASIAILTLWIVWYAMNRSQTSVLVKKYGIEPTFNLNVMWLLQGIFLMLPVIAGATLIFIYWNKTRSMDNTRRNFISSVSHELLTPLTSMKLHLETMMMRETPAEERKKFHELMLVDADRLEDLISRLLRVSRIERSREMFHFVEADLAQLIEAYIRDNQNMIEGVSLVLDLQEGCNCWIDSSTFNIVIKNLIQNAIRYSTDKPRISINLKSVGNKVHLRVSDEGCGVGKKDLKKIFKMFYRATKKHKGTGLGLYIVKSLIKSNKGKVWAVSKGLGSGTEFNILLPKLSNIEG